MREFASKHVLQNVHVASDEQRLLSSETAERLTVAPTLCSDVIWIPGKLIDVVEVAHERQRCRARQTEALEYAVLLAKP